MTPNKIYIPQHNIEAGTIQELGELIIEGSVEYIRKDALVEWANSWLAFKRSEIVLDDGFSYAMEELIKKLNEM